MAPRAMAQLLPEFWGTAKAAERWLAKNAPEAYREIIRVWGVLNTYRPPGQTSWSKAVARHGADPAAALAKVLEANAGELQDTLMDGLEGGQRWSRS